MNSENTFPYKTNIVTEKKPTLNPEIGDKLIFCPDEDTALSYYQQSASENHEPVENEFLTDFFKLGVVHGKVCEPIYIGVERFGFFGCRTKTPDTNQGLFYLYKME